MPENYEAPRLSILKNFKSINRVMRSSFLHKAEHQEEGQYVDLMPLALKMKGIMKQMEFTKRFKPDAYSARTKF